MIVLGVALLLLAVVLLTAWLGRPRRQLSEYELAIRLRKQFDALALAIGAEMTPVLKRAAFVMQEIKRRFDR